MYPWTRPDLARVFLTSLALMALGATSPDPAQSQEFPQD